MTTIFPVNPETTLIVPVCRVVGGKTQRRSNVSDRHRRDGGRITEADLKITIDNELERKRAEALAFEGVYLVRRAATSTTIGYVTDRAGAQRVRQDFDELRTRVADFNHEARTCSVETTVLCLHIAMQIGPEVAQVLHAEIREELLALLAVVQANNKPAIKKVYYRALRIPALTVGVLAQAVRFALEQAKEAMSMECDAPSWNMIESAAELFTPSESESEASAG